MYEDPRTKRPEDNTRHRDRIFCMDSAINTYASNPHIYDNTTICTTHLAVVVDFMHIALQRSELEEKKKRTEKYIGLTIRQTNTNNVCMHTCWTSVRDGALCFCFESVSPTSCICVLVVDHRRTCIRFLSHSFYLSVSPTKNKHCSSTVVDVLW